MSHYMTALAMKQVGLKPAAKIVLYWLADHYNQSTGECFPSHKRLAELCEMTDRSVRLHLDQLAEAGLIEVVKRTRDNGSQTSNSYHLKMRTDDDGRKIFPTPQENISTPPVQIFPTLNPVNNNLVNEPEELRGAKAQKQRKPEMDLPEGWIPNDKNVQDAIDRGFSETEIENEADRFANFHSSKQNRFRDWDAAWRSWLARARQYRTNDRGKGGARSGMAEAFASVAADCAARERNRAENTERIDDFSLWGVDLS
jgi:DNA-binding transcriptional ArsR family regulator